MKHDRLAPIQLHSIQASSARLDELLVYAQHHTLYRCLTSGNASSEQFAILWPKVLRISPEVRQIEKALLLLQLINSPDSSTLRRS